MKRIIRPLILLLLVAGAGYYWYRSSRPVPLVLTGIVTTKGVVSQQELDQAHTQYMVAQSKIDSLVKQIDAQRAAVQLARSNADQVSVRRSQLETNQKQQAAAAAQSAKAGVRLGYTELRAPIDGIVDVRAARIGEVVTPGQPIVTLINPD